MNDNHTHKDKNLFYITENILGPVEQSDEYEQLFYNYNSQLEHCLCDNICFPESCKCLQKSCGKTYISYEKDGLQQYKLISTAKPYPIIECNDCCSCSIDCGNRVVHKGPIEDIEIRNGDKGLGLFATTFIPAGTFICEYAGELITTSQATLRHQKNKLEGKMNYILCLRELSSQNEATVTVVDPYIFGNIGRYLNHSCEPNCFVTPVRCGSPIPKLAIFALVDISPDEELTFHYGVSDKVNTQNESDLTRCLCKTKSCSGFMPFHGY